jgi:hypothetical protein
MFLQRVSSELATLQAPAACGLCTESECAIVVNCSCKMSAAGKHMSYVCCLPPSPRLKMPSELKNLSPHLCKCAHAYDIAHACASVQAHAHGRCA